MAKIWKTILDNKILLFILILGGILRFLNLGYSDFQGDEIKALYLPGLNENLIDFLLRQRKGPIQFLITYLLKFLDPSYQNNFFLRFPFALASFVSLPFYYLYLNKVFNKPVAVAATLLLATNGFFVAFSRIVQYQSFVLLFAILSLYLLKNKKMVGGYVFWSLSILAHYDGVFIFPLVLLYTVKFAIDPEMNLSVRVKTLLFSMVSFLFLLGCFYIPFAFNISTETQGYWLSRFEGSEETDKISDSVMLFRVYQPYYATYLYQFLFYIGLGSLVIRTIDKKKVTPIGGTFFENFSLLEMIAFGGWLLTPLYFYEGIMSSPGTHIYTYILPLFVFAGIGADLIWAGLRKNKLSMTAFAVSAAAMGLFLFAQSYSVFVDHGQEYPFEKESMSVWVFEKPEDKKYHLNIFGFPYHRDWRGVAAFLEQYPTQTYGFSSNENRSISSFYIKHTEPKGRPYLFVWIENPQSFTTKSKIEFTSAPVFIYEKDGQTLTKIYLMEP